MIKTKKQMYTVIGAFILIMLLTTVTYAFFNYTRTGVANNIRTGRIYFNTSQNGTLNLTNMFPVASSEVGNSNQIEVRVYGDTTYTGGEEFEISLVSVNNTIVSGSTEKTIPVNYIASYTRTPVATGETPNAIGTSSNDYFSDRGSTTAVYQLKSAGEVSEGEQVLIGYIPKDVAIDGTLTIKAYLDRSNIAITDTYNEASPETDYNGTTTNWVNGRTVLTTTEWNALQNTPISFKVKAVANEGTWVEDTRPKPASQYLLANVQTLEETSYGKIYTGSNPDNYVWFNGEQWRIIGVYGDKLKIVRATPLTQKRAYNASTSDGNVWSGSALETFLNGDYYNGVSNEGLTETSRGMIAEGTWNAGATPVTATANTAYQAATETQVSNKKVGLIATYEYLYAAGNECRNVVGDSMHFAVLSCGDLNWLKPSNNGWLWTLTPEAGFSETVFEMVDDGALSSGEVSYSDSVLPVVFLDSSVTITGGNGQIGETNSYKLGLN